MLKVHDLGHIFVDQWGSHTAVAYLPTGSLMTNKTKGWLNSQALFSINEKLRQSVTHSMEYEMSLGLTLSVFR